MIILKGQVTHTTHSYTNTLKKKEKKLVEKERQHKKAKYASIKQRKSRKRRGVDKSAILIYQ